MLSQDCCIFVNLYDFVWLSLIRRAITQGRPKRERTDRTTYRKGRVEACRQTRTTTPRISAPTSNQTTELPHNERRLAADTTLQKPSPPDDEVTVRVILRRRTDATPPISLAQHLNAHPLRREVLSEEEYAKWYGASDKDIKQVREFLESGKGGLDVVEVHPASRTIVAKGTVSQVEKLFGITLNEYSLTGTGEGPEGGMSSETYRSHEDPLTVRTDLADVIVGVFGLHTRSMVSSSGPNSPNNTSKAASPNTVPAVMQHYNFPTDANGKPLRATGETIGIFAPKYKSNTSIPPGNEVCGYAQSDIDKYYQTPQLSHLTAPTICVQSVDGTVNSPQSPNPEVRKIFVSLAVWRREPR